MSDITIGCVGVGAGGNKLADSFAELDYNFNCLAINTAPQDLKNLKNIPDDNKYHSKINETGGAGKDIRLGENAIKIHKNNIKELIKVTFKNTDFIWVQAGLGGGSGTLGCIQISRILAEMGIMHGIMATTPASNEDSVSLINAVAGIEMIEKARNTFTSTLRPVVLIDNNQLKSKVFTENNISYEDLWYEANNYIRDSFIKIFEFTKESGQQNIDTTDYMRLIKHRGYMMFNQGKIETDNTSADVLSKGIVNYWKNSIFMAGGIKQSKGVAIVLNRKNKENDADKIDNLFNSVKEYFGSIHFVPGVYSTDDKLGFLDKVKNRVTDYNKPIEIHTMLTGLPFPASRVKQLESLAKKEINEINSKSNEKELYTVDKSLFKGVFDEEPVSDIDEGLDFGFFDNLDENEEVTLENKKMDWNNLKI